MCCRYFIDDESEQFRTIIEEMSRSPLLGKWKPAAAIKTSGEISCIVPATYYFEWEHRAAGHSVTKTVSKYAIHPKDTAMTWLCGLYRIEGGVPRFVVLTREPADAIRFIHNRMPLILPEEFLDEWIRPDAEPEKLLCCAVTDMEFEKSN